MKKNKLLFIGLIALFAINPVFSAPKKDFMAKANSAMDKEDYESAVYYLELSYLAGNQDKECLSLLGRFYADGIGVPQDYDESLYYYEEALEVIKEDKTSTDEDYFNIYFDMGFVYDKLCEYTQAMASYTNSLQYAQKAYGENSLPVVAGYNAIGCIYYVWGDFTQSLFYHEKALKIALGIDKGVNYGVADSYNNIANVYSDQNKIKEALDYYNKAISIWAKVYGKESDAVALGYYNLSYLYSDLEKYDEALTYANKALAIQLAVFGDEYEDTAITYKKIANIYLQKKDFKKAEENFYNALDILSSLYGDYHTDVADTYYEMGFMYYDKAQYSDAIECLESAFDAYEFSEDFNRVIERAWNVFAHIGEVPKKYKFDFDEIKLQALAVGIEAAENIRNVVDGKKEQYTAKALPLYYAGVDMYAENFEEKNSFYYSEMLRSRGFLDEIGTEAALKLDGITDEDRALFKQYSAEVQKWTKKLAAENGKGKGERKQSEADSYNQQLIEARKKLTDFDATLGKKVPAYTQLRNPEPVSFGDAKQWCGKNKVILEYVVWNESYADLITKKDVNDINTAVSSENSRSKKASEINSYCIMVTNRKVIPVKLDASYNYTAAADRLRAMIKERKTYEDKEFNALRKELYEKLVEPISLYIPITAENILIVPDGVLSFIPFDILTDKDGIDFGEEYNISMSPSVSVSMMTDENTNAKGNKILALGNAVYDADAANSEDRGFQKKTLVGSPKMSTKIPVEVLLKQYAEQEQAGKYYETKGISWTNIPGTGIEVHNLKDNAFVDVKFDLIEGAEVSEENLKKLSAEKKLRDYSVIHFACHGYFDPQYSQMSSLVMSEVSQKRDDKKQDGYLTLSETSLLDINAKFVNLSACQTGLGQLKKGDGMTGLTRSFLVAGAGNIGVTLWSVDDEATCEFMTRMYSYVSKDGYSYKEAYAKVKSEFRKNPKWNSPYYWAAFVLYE